MNDEKLIELVRNSPVLYDLSNAKYMNTEFKNTIWNQIGAEMKISASLCRTRWGNIRDNFKKSLKRNKTANGRKGKNIKQYKYADQLRFLEKFFEEREKRSNIDDEDDNAVTILSKRPISSNLRRKRSIQYPIPQKKTKKSEADAMPLKTAAATVMEYLVKRHESIDSSSSTTQHPVDAFLTGIAPALKNLPPQDWHYAKADLFAAVQKYELKMLMDQQLFAKSSRSSSSRSTPICVYPEPSSPTGSDHQTASANEYRKTDN